MTCPAGCLRLPGHTGFHTTHPGIAEREDALDANPLGPPATKPNRDLRRFNISFVSDPTMPPGEAILSNRDGSSAVRIIGIGERGEENAIRAGRKMLELIKGLKE